MRSLIISTAEKNIQKWCHYTKEVSYTRNISYHRAIKLTPYEAVYGIKPHREIMNSNAEENTQNHSQEENEQEVSGNDEEPPNKRQKIIENQTKYNTDMIDQTKRKQQNKQPKF